MNSADIRSISDILLTGIQKDIVTGSPFLWRLADFQAEAGMLFQQRSEQGLRFRRDLADIEVGFGYEG